MFDIGFWELMIIGLVALLVVGPERLPKLAYTAGKWLGKGRSMVGSIKAEIDKEMKAEELKQIIEEQKKQLNPFEEVIEETTETLNEFKNETENVTRDAQTEHGSKDESYTRFGDSAKESRHDSDDE